MPPACSCPPCSACSRANTAKAASKKCVSDAAAAEVCVNCHKARSFARCASVTSTATTSSASPEGTAQVRRIMLVRTASAASAPPRLLADVKDIGAKAALVDPGT